MTAHVNGLPVEEVLPLLMGGGGAWLVLRVTTLAAVHRRRTVRRQAGRSDS